MLLLRHWRIRNLCSLKGAEIGEAMVDPFILATAHPDNISNHLMQKDGFKLHKVFERRGYLRNMYLKIMNY